MIIREFPDIQWLKNRISTFTSGRQGSDPHDRFANGWPTCILNVRSSFTAREDIRGPFSIFMNVRGSSAVTAGGRQVKLNANTFVLTNNDEHYSLYIPRDTETETLNIHFGQAAFNGIFYTLVRKDMELLDQPESGNQRAPLFPFRNAFRSEAFNHLAQRLFSQPQEEDLILMDFARLVAAEYIPEIARGERLHTVKASTRLETLRRLYLATDYMHASFHRPITMDEVAKVCALSKFHFLRSFREAFGLSPYQYLKELRTRKALELIRHTDDSIENICLLVGLENGSSLSRLIHQQTGAYPTQLRTGRLVLK